MKQRINELFGFGKKKRIQCIIVVADLPNIGEYALMEISKNVEQALKTDNRVQDLEAFYHDADSLPVAKEAYSGRAKTVFMYTCATYDDYDAIEARVRNFALDGFVWSSRVDYQKKLNKILHFDIVLPDLRKKESFTQGVRSTKDNVWEALDELYEDMPQPVDYSGMPEAQLIKTAYDLGKQSSELVNKIRYHQAAQGPSYWAQRGALQKAQQDFDAMSAQYDAVEAQLVKRGLDVWSTLNTSQISLVAIGIDANDAIKLSPDLTIYKYCVDQSGKLVNLLTRPSYYLSPTVDTLCIPYLIASTEAAHPGATCKPVPASIIKDGCYAYEQKTKMVATYTMADTLTSEVAALLPTGYTGVVYFGSGANTLSSEPQFSRNHYWHHGLFKSGATLEGQVDRRPIRQFTELAYLVNNAVAPKASTTFNVDVRAVQKAASAASARQYAQWQAEYDQQRRLARNAKARERRAALKAKASAAADDTIQ